MKWIAVVFALSGWAIVALEHLWGIVVALAGSLLWTWLGYRMHEPSIAVLNAGFALIQFSGTINLFF